jgi:chaperonin GroES
MVLKAGDKVLYGKYAGTEIELDGEQFLIMRQSDVLAIIYMSIRPLVDRVLVRPAVAEEKTVGGIIIPDSAKEKPLKGEVVAVGNGTKDEQMVLKAGDKVLYGKYAGTEIELDGEKFLIMRQSDVLAII